MHKNNSRDSSKIMIRSQSQLCCILLGLKPTIDYFSYSKCFGAFRLKSRAQIMFVVILVTVSSCKSTLETIKTSNDLESSIGFVVDYINNCVDGTNQINVDEKAEFDLNTKILTIYKGKSADDFKQKWEIPLAELDPTSIKLDDSELSGNKVTIYTTGKKKKIKYYKDGSHISTVEENNYYLGYCWKKSKEKEYFIESYRRAIILSKSE